MVVETATRRRADGGPSARSLLISVLGQWVGPNDTPVWTATLVGALEALGIESRAARQAVNRTASDGWLEGESVGRYTRWRLTSSGRRMIGSAVPRVQRSIVADQKWDGTFLLLTLTGNALDRVSRERLAVGLDFEGFGTLGTGTWVAVGEGSREGADVVLTACGLQEEALLFHATTVDGAETPAEVVAHPLRRPTRPSCPSSKMRCQAMILRLLPSGPVWRTSGGISSASTPRCLRNCSRPIGSAPEPERFFSASSANGRLRQRRTT